MYNNNEGFSLVELLVSIVILTIIVIPVLDNIVLSSRMNKNSREKQNVTMLASNLLETTKIEEEVSSIAKELLYPESETYATLFVGADTEDVSVRQVEKAGSAYETVANPEKKEDYTFKENGKKSYTFAVDNLKVNNKSYDALITYDASAYTGDGTTTSINDQEIPVISSVVSKNNAVISEGYSDSWAASSLKHLYNQWFNTFRTGENKVSNDEIAASMSREFTITVSYNAGKGKYVVDGTIVYTIGTNLISADPTFEPYREYENRIFHSEFETLSEIYLFYKPNFTNNRDRITIDNKLPAEKEKLIFNIIAQAKSGVDFTEKMKGYGVELTIKEENGQQNTSSTKIRSNLGLEDTTNTRNKITCDNRSALLLQGLVEKEKKTRLYEVTVAIYTADDNKEYQDKNLITKMTSTKGVE